MFKVNHAEAKEFEIVKPGEYEVIVVNYELKTAASGNNRVIVDYEIRSDVDQPSQGQKILFDNFTVTEKAMWRFQAASKAAQFPDFINRDQIDSITSFDEVDHYFTAPLHGFASRDEYYQQVSPEFSLKNITTPVLIINSLDDPFLGERCYPRAIAQDSEYVYLETPKYGGHCAFPLRNSSYSYAEKRAYEFFKSCKPVEIFKA